MKFARWLPLLGCVVGAAIGVARGSLPSAAPIVWHVLHHVGPVVIFLAIGFLAKLTVEKLSATVVNKPRGN